LTVRFLFVYHLMQRRVPLLNKGTFVRIKSLATSSIIIVNMLAPLAVQATSSSLVISEIQTASATNSGQEFVELYNPTGADVVVDGWMVQYKSATSAITESSWTKRADLKGTIKSHGFYLISQKSYLPQTDAELSGSGLAGTGGHVRLRDSNGSVIDLVGWGPTANAAESNPAAPPTAGQSIERLPGRLNESGGNATDSDNNSQDFVIRETPQPQSTASSLEVPGAVLDPAPIDQVPGDDESTAPASPTYLPILITEILPDPAAPLTDANDEFVELYNPNDTAVNLEGYTLRAGSNFHDYYNLPELTMNAGAYLAIYAKDSHVALTNGGGAAQLLDPAGNEVAVTGTYGAAVTGATWALFDSDWQWTLQSTPGTDNVLVTPVLPGTSPKSSKTAKVTVAKAKTTKVAAAKTTKPKATKKTATSNTAKAPLVAAAAHVPSIAWLLIGLAILSIGYAAYEFRHDLRNYYHLTRRYLHARRAAR
jgi:hypothetical protein